MLRRDNKIILQLLDKWHKTLHAVCSGTAAALCTELYGCRIQLLHWAGSQSHWWNALLSRLNRYLH